jgi:branched-chain amino acid aminotransferase
MGLKVERRNVPVEELDEMDEVGACGNRGCNTPVGTINYRGRDIVFGDGKNAGPSIKGLYERLLAIQTGEYPDKHGWLYEVEL